MRRLEQRVEYGNGLVDEWAPVAEETECWSDLWGMTGRDVADFVRRWNREARARGDNTRIRSVDVEEE